MGNELNAIRVGDTIEKVHIDFSSLESLKESTGFKRLYTIHTAKTNEMSAKLGFHVGGFCDDRGGGSTVSVGDLVGYEYLPSDLILCLMDNQYNFLPLDEKRLEIFFHYLLTGEVLTTAFKAAPKTSQEEGDEEIMEETIEESLENEYDDEVDMMHYILFFKVDSKWAKSEDKMNTYYEFCYPLIRDKKPMFAFFDSLFEVEGFDRIHEVVSLKLNRGKVEHINIKKGEDFDFDFAYKKNSNDDSYREGHATLSLRYFNFESTELPGKLYFNYKYVVGGKAEADETQCIDQVTDDLDIEPFVDLQESGDRYGIFLIDEPNKLLIIYGLRDSGKEGEMDEFYLPVWFDKPNEEYLGYIEEGQSHEVINTITYKK